MTMTPVTFPSTVADDELPVAPVARCLHRLLRNSWRSPVSLLVILFRLSLSSVPGSRLYDFLI